jgi:2-polyprenyl-3-methyl-5-hydroxy-6-metoxy-1,4-benzoquinol methylase
MKIRIIYSSHERLNFNEQKNKNVDFLKRRLTHFYPEDQLEFVEKEGESQNVLDELESNDIIIGLSLFDVLLDDKIVSKMIRFAEKYDKKIIVEGAVPGSAPNFVTRKINFFKSTKTLLDNTQRIYNTQLNLYRLKRVKIFNSFVEKFDDFHSWSTSKLLDFTSSDEGVEFVLGYGSDLKMSYYQSCPFCNSKEIENLHSDSGHPVMGFLTKNSIYYQYCQDCELVFLNPHLKQDDLHIYYDAYNFETPFRTETIDTLLDNLNNNNVSHLSNYVAVRDYINQLPPNAFCLDIGGGNGEFCQFLKQERSDLEVKLFDFRIDDVLMKALNKRDIQASQCDIIKEDFGINTYHLITNWEVIEHIDLLQIKNYFEKVYKALCTGGIYIFSTPDFKDDFSKALDFWAMAPGEHLSVFSRSVLEPILAKIGFELIDERHESVTVKIADRWFKYGSESNSNFACKAESKIINSFLKEEYHLEHFKENLRAKNIGSEMILILKKLNKHEIN